MENGSWNRQKTYPVRNLSCWICANIRCHFLTSRYHHPRSRSYTNPAVAKWTAKIADGDGFIIVTPEYSHGYPAVLKNALDYVYKEWNGKKIAFVGYGGVGAARAIEQLRQVVIELQMIPMRSAVHITKFWELFDEKGQLKLDKYNQDLKSVLDQLK